MDKIRQIDPPSVISERLKIAIASKNVKQKDLAEATGFSRVYINSIVQGRKPSYSSDNHLRKIADALKINADWLIYGTGTMTHALHNGGVAFRQVNYDDMVILDVCKASKAENPLGYELLKEGTSLVLPKVLLGSGSDPFILQADSDLLSPTISKGDYIIIQGKQSTPRDGHIYALWYANSIQLRYITLNLNGSYTLSTSPDGSRADNISMSEASSLVIIGEIIGKISSFI